MKKVLFTLLFFYKSFSIAQTPGEWTWMKGDTVIGSIGNLGVQGVSSPANNPRSAYENCEWTDLNGCFWLFGGRNLNGYYSDLYKYDPALNEWTWMKGPGIPNDTGVYGTKGISSPANYPPARGMGTATWTDHQNNLWMFGGASSYGGYNDLWKYNISTNEWTWMKGSNFTNDGSTYGVQGVPSIFNKPGSRWESTANWVDANGDLWLFGGLLIYYGNRNFNDLWRYNISSNEWTWMKGSSGINQASVYGTQGIEDNLNTPGGREVYSNWMDGQGNFWLFGGATYLSSVNNTYWNDTWKYNPVTNNWTWITGGNVGNELGYYNQKCDTSYLNSPSSRVESRAEWKDNNGNFWLFGGYNNGLRNDLWMFCVKYQKWVFVHAAAPRWGIQGVSDSLNSPGQRMGCNGWLDNNGYFYMYGGGDPTYSYNDVWRFVVDTNCGACFSVPTSGFSALNFLCPGTCTSFFNQSTDAITYQWNFFGASPDTSTELNPQNICYANSGSYDVQLIASNVNGSDTLLLSNYITVYPSPPAQSITQSGDTLSAIAGANSYQWYFNGSIITGSTNYFYVATQSGDYNVVATDGNGCEVEAVINNVIAYSPLAAGGLPLVIFPNPVAEELIIKNEVPIAIGIRIETAISISIYNMLGELAVEPVTRNYKPETVIDVSSLPNGIYWLEISTEGKKFRGKFVKQ